MGRRRRKGRQAGLHRDPDPRHDPRHMRQIPNGQWVCIDRIVCPHCGCSGVANVLARYHFNNCLLWGLQQALRDVEDD